MTQVERTEPAVPAVPEPLLSWRVHPARRRPRRTAFVIGLLLLVAFILYLSTASLWLTGLALFLLTGSLGEYLFASTYHVSAQGAERCGLAGPRRVTWAEVKAAYLLDDGIKLSTLARPGPLEPYRGVFLPFADDDQRAAVLAVVDQHANARRRSPEAPQAEMTDG